MAAACDGTTCRTQQVNTLLREAISYFKINFAAIINLYNISMSQFLPEENRKKASSRLQGTLGVFMGLLYIAIAVISAYRINKGLLPDGVFDIGITMSWILITVFILYGVFRIFRGVKSLKSA